METISIIVASLIIFGVMVGALVWLMKELSLALKDYRDMQ